MLTWRARGAKPPAASSDTPLARAALRTPAPNAVRAAGAGSRIPAVSAEVGVGNSETCGRPAPRTAKAQPSIDCIGDELPVQGAFKLPAACTAAAHDAADVEADSFLLQQPDLLPHLQEPLPQPRPPVRRRRTHCSPTAAALAGTAVAAFRRRASQAAAAPLVASVTPATAAQAAQRRRTGAAGTTTAASAAAMGVAGSEPATLHPQQATALHAARRQWRSIASACVVVLVALAVTTGAARLLSATGRTTVGPAAWGPHRSSRATVDLAGAVAGGAVGAASGPPLASGLRLSAGWLAGSAGPPRVQAAGASGGQRAPAAVPSRGWWSRLRRPGGAAGSGRLQSGGRGGLPALAVGAGGDGRGGSAGGSDLEWRESASVRVVTVVSTGASPYRTTWDSLAAHTAERLGWSDPGYQMLVFEAERLGADQGMQRAFLRALSGGAHMVVGLGVAGGGVEEFLRSPTVSALLPGIVLFVGGAQPLANALTRLQGGLRPQDPDNWRTALGRRLSWTPDGRGLAVWDTVQVLLGRHNSDDFLFVYLVLINQYVAPVPAVRDTTKGFDVGSIICMIRHCGEKVVGCVNDPTCKSALDCLNACTFNDQVCQYRCIVSHESRLLEQFSLCILQLHNCRELNAQPPALPDPAPMASFRGAPLTHEAAEDMFIGWLDEPQQGAPRGALLRGQGKPFSWLVAGGKNPAYDYFPCQHQLFYRGKGKGQVWYEPVFKAITLDGREVWRRRVYRVRRAKVPGSFHLSVLDNGVVSNEFWRIVDCDEELGWCLFFYSGAASAAGLSYSGAVLGTPDGRMPGAQHTERLHAALRRAGIEPWELSFVDNSACGGAPLGITGPVAAPA